MDSLIVMCYATAGANVLLLSGILYPGMTNFLKTRSSIPALLVVFALIFLVQNVVAIYFDVVTQYTQAVEFEVMVLSALQTAGLGALFWVTYK